MQGVTQDLETGGQYWGFFKFRGSKVSYTQFTRMFIATLYIDIAKQSILFFIF